MPHVQLDTNWPDSPKIIDAGFDGAGLHVAVMALYARKRKGVERSELIRRGASEALVNRLLDLCLIEEVDGLIVPDMGRSRLMGGRRHIPADVRREVMERDGRACLVCGATEDLSLDHIHPYSLGGLDTVDNLRVLCRPCNSRKGATF